MGEKALFFIFIIFIFLLSSCSENIVTGVSIDKQPQTMEEFYAEALLISMEDKILVDEAQISLARVYTDFQQEEPGFFAPAPKYIRFINCTSTAESNDFSKVGRTTIVYEYSGKTKQRIFRDICNEQTRIMTKHFCSGDRFAILRHRCSHGCWMNEHCK